MRKISAGFLLSFLSLAGCAQPEISRADNDNTLLWKVSGKGISKPSYLFGTIHMLCADDARLSNSLQKVIGNVSEIYFEVDLDNMFEMLQVMSKMKMRGDTTLRELLSDADYKKVKEYFQARSTMLPFSMLETYKPMLAASLLGQEGLPCEQTAMMEQVIMEEAKKKNKKIQGLESMAYQAGVLDKIPYRLQAEQLLRYIENAESGKKEDEELNSLFDAYREQDLHKLEELMMKSELGLTEFTDILLVNRNENWVEKLKGILPAKSVLIAVGAGHLPGDKGVISLLRKAGYTVEPLENRIVQMTEI